MANDIFSTLRTYLSKISDGDKNASEVASTVNQWLREGGEALKIKIEDEVERSVSKMGFVKRGEFEALKEEVARLRMQSQVPNAKKTAPAATGTKKSTAKKSTAKKTATKKASSR
jgi:BMFP domain-containing protein YqiC